MKLTGKVMLALLAAVALLSAVAGYISVRAIYRDFEDQQQTLARQLADELHERLDLAWRQQGLSGMLRLLDELAPRNGQSLQMRWVWFEPNVAPEQKPHGAPEYWTGLEPGEIISIMGSDADGSRRLHTYLPLPLRSPLRGGLEITESLANVERQTRRTAWITLATIGSVAVVCLATAYLAGLVWVARPLEALTKKTQRIGEGDFSQPLHLSGDDELTQLATALNEMCDRLAAQQAIISAETAQREAALDQLRHADRLKTVGRLAAGVAHELGTPLNVVAGRAALIVSGKLSSDEVHASAKTIKAEADRIATIVRHLLDFARRSPPQRARVDLRPLIQRTCELLEPLAEKQQVCLAWDESGEPMWAAVDQGQLQQSLTNLIINAIQAMPEGGDVRITLAAVTAAPPGNATSANRPWVRIRVADTGPGIPAEIRDQVFEPFFTTKAIGEGTGLGLSIAYGMIQEHGGWIDVSSNTPHGSQFDVYLPAEEPA